MKKTILIALAFIGLQVTAQQDMGKQQNREKGRKMMNLSAEEMATLQTKKMTLALDLNESQQEKVYAINLENATIRKSKMEARKTKRESGNTEKPSKEEKLKMMNDMLDHKIEVKAKMKKILDDEQYAKWEAQAKKSTSKRKKSRRKQ